MICTVPDIGASSESPTNVPLTASKPRDRRRESSPRKNRLESSSKPNVDAREYRLFRSLDTRCDGTISVADLQDSLASIGLRAGDPRLAELSSQLNERSGRDTLSFEQFCDLIRPNILLVERALQGNMVVPDFQGFCDKLANIFAATEPNVDGKVADYIPQLSRVDAEKFAVSVCTVDGQHYSLGDADHDFCIQSCCKPMNYCLALEDRGAKEVHRYVGCEPSGRNFNELALNDQGKPHNPMINAGAIMTASLVKSELDNADRFEYVLSRWEAMCGGRKARFNNAIYQSERATADRNFALGYYMKEHKAFPEGTDLLKTLDFYFQCCSIEVDAEQMAVFAATLANGGVCPTSGERVLQTGNVQHCLSLMCSCGMYDFSGEFAFVVGLPAKSGVGGGIMIAIPNVMGICIWSPRLDAHGNSVRGIELCNRLVETFSLHNFDNLSVESSKIDPRVDRIESKAERVAEMIWAASKGDVGAIHRLTVRGHDQDAADYDGRTPLHLAAAEGQGEVIRYFIQNGAQLSPRDRWGGTPLDDAARHGHAAVVGLLEKRGAVRGPEDQPQMQDASNSLTSADAGVPADHIVELIYAASEGDLRAVQRLVARGVHLEAADYDLRTPLHLAAAEGRLEMVQYFIDQDTPLSPRDRWGNTPLDEAKRHGQSGVVQLLNAAPNLNA